MDEKLTYRDITLCSIQNELEVNNICGNIPYPEFNLINKLNLKLTERNVFYRISNSNNENIGIAVMYNIDYKNMNAIVDGYVIGDNYTPDLIKSILCLNNLAFREFNFEKVYAIYREDNYYKQHFWENLRFTHEGILRNHIFSEGRYKNIVIKSMLKYEFERFFLCERNVDRVMK